jgi:hypothetical protein
MFAAKEKEIDGLKVVVTQWPARKALTTKLKLIRIIGPGLGELVGGFKGKGEGLASALDSDMNMERFTPALEKLLSALSEEMFMSLVITLMSSVRVNDVDMSSEKEFNMQFAGSLESFYKIVWFVLEVNYGSFFGESGIGNLKGMMEKLTPSSPMPQKNSQKI